MTWLSIEEMKIEIQGNCQFFYQPCETAEQQWELLKQQHIPAPSPPAKRLNLGIAVRMRQRWNGVDNAQILIHPKEWNTILTWNHIFPGNDCVILSADAFYQLKQFKGGGRDTAFGESKGSVRKRKVWRYWQIEAVIHGLICHLWFHLCGGKQFTFLETFSVLTSPATYKSFFIISRASVRSLSHTFEA